MIIKFKDVLYVKGRIGWQSLKKDEYLQHGDYYLITGININDDNSIDYKSCYYVSKERYEIDESIQLKNGDIILTKDGTIGKIGLISNLDKPATLNSHLFLIRNLRPDIINTKYLFYLFQSDKFTKYSLNNTYGSNIPAFTQKNFTEYETDLPTLYEQEKISKILDMLDLQIKRNNNMVQKLQVLVHTTFDYFSKNNTKSNFVVLNDILVEKDKSKIQVSDVLDVSGFIPFFTSGETVLYTNKKLETGFNIFLSTGGNAKVQAYYGDAAYSTDTWCITAKNNLQFYLFGYLNHIKSQMDKLYFHGTGLKHLQKPIFLKSIITIPNEDLLIKYNTIVEPIYHQISKIEQSTIQLQYLKNKLLPLLINQQLV